MKSVQQMNLTCCLTYSKTNESSCVFCRTIFVFPFHFGSHISCLFGIVARLFKVKRTKLSFHFGQANGKPNAIHSAAHSIQQWQYLTIALLSSIAYRASNSPLRRNSAYLIQQLTTSLDNTSLLYCQPTKNTLLSQ